MRDARCAAALAVLVPVLGLLWTLNWVIRLLGALSRVVTRWGGGSARAVLVPVVALLRTLDRVIQLLGGLGRVVTRWGADPARLEGAE